MKSHTVKSNAMRAARKLCEKHSAFEPAEPKAAPDGGWHPAVRQIATVDELPADIIEGAAVILKKTTSEPEDIPAFLPKRSPMSPAAVKAAIDMPATQSSAEEIATRRAESLERRIAKARNPGAELKAETNRGAKTKQALDMMRLEAGATSVALQQALGWQPHTLRGFISTQKSKGIAIGSARAGKITTYRIAG